jgi:alkaline phosphatase D
MKRVILLALFCTLLSGVLEAKSPYTKGENNPIMKDFDPFMIDQLEDGTGKQMSDLAKTKKFRKLVQKHDLKLMGGPMLGRMTGTSVDVWMRTTQPAEVQVFARPANGSGNTIRSQKMQATAARDLVAEVRLDGLSPNTAYRYQVRVNGEPVFKKNQYPGFRTYPRKGQPGKSRVAFAACSRYIPKNEDMWTFMNTYKPQGFLTLGDNVYIDAPKNFSKQRLHYYRRQLRPEYKKFTASTSTYATWDDHDFGKNDSAGGTDPFKPSWKPKVWQIFRQNWVNPYYGGGKEYPGTWFDFYVGDVHFIVTDGRYYRDFDKGTMLGKRQLKWLLNTLKNSKGTFKILASSTLWTSKADKGGADSWWGVKEERNRIFDFIAENKINGVVLISGDRHRADVYKMDWKGDYTLWEFENAILTNKHHHGTRDQAHFSYVDKDGHLFGLFDFDTAADDPKLRYRVITKQDETVFEKTLHLSDLTH